MRTQAGTIKSKAHVHIPTGGLGCKLDLRTTNPSTSCEGEQKLTKENIKANMEIPHTPFETSIQHIS
jgi:hypothetical protein